MMTQLAFYLMISAGSMLCCTVWKKKYEELLPVTASSIVLIIFLCGVIFHDLTVGIALVGLLSVAIYVLSILYIRKMRCFRETMKNILTPGFLIFTFFFIALSIFNVGKVADGWDEFSHWADIVKAMVQLDDFGTNPASHSLFQSYPPAMSLFQYFLQRIHTFVTGNGEFSEWRLYFAYQIFFLSMFMPFTKKLNYKKWSYIPIVGVLIFLTPLFFYQNIYSKIYIDPFLGILSGAGLAMVFLETERDYLFHLNIWLTISILVLSKDAGMLFALILGIIYMFSLYKEEGRKKKEKRIFAVGTLAAILLPKILWNINIKITGANVAFQNYNASANDLWKVFSGHDDTYRTGVIKSYWDALFTRKVPIGNTTIELNYMVLFAVCMIILYLLLRMYRWSDSDGRGKYLGRLLFVTMFVQFVIWLIGVCLIYITKFAEYEAVALASFDRYVRIVYLSAEVLLVLLVIGLFEKIEEKQAVVYCVTLCTMLNISPLYEVNYFVTQKNVTASAEFRMPYNEIVEKINSVANAGTKVCLISQEDNGLDYGVIGYSIRPAIIGVVGYWSIGQPFYEGDIYTVQISAEEWRQGLIDNGFDYVALYKINDYFLNNYASVFAPGEEISANSVYQVSQETGMLKKVSE